MWLFVKRANIERNENKSNGHSMPCFPNLLDAEAMRDIEASLDWLLSIQTSARRALDLIWRKGVLHKGAGICHGVAGSVLCRSDLYHFWKLTSNANREGIVHIAVVGVRRSAYFAFLSATYLFTW
uniref:Uncharacterized protein n=1 Tax=Parascaris equorum TaxID=6256 RepID=A0A914RTK7_PAREQ